MAYTGNGAAGSCYYCGRDKEEVHYKNGNVGCSSCKDKYFREIEEENKKNSLTLLDHFAMSCPESVAHGLDYVTDEEIREIRGKSGRPLTRLELMDLACKIRYEYAHIMMKNR